jgi:hypothetical protein
MARKPQPKRAKPASAPHKPKSLVELLLTYAQYYPECLRQHRGTIEYTLKLLQETPQSPKQNSAQNLGLGTDRQEQEDSPNNNDAGDANDANQDVGLEVSSPAKDQEVGLEVSSAKDQDSGEIPSSYERPTQQDLPENGELLFSDCPAGSFLRSLINLIPRVKTLIALSKKGSSLDQAAFFQWLGPTSKNDDIRILISAPEDQRDLTGPEQNQTGLSDRSLFLDYKKWESQQDGDPGQKHIAIPVWAEEVMRFPRLNRSIAAIRRGGHYCDFEEKLGEGISLFLFSTPSKFSRLVKDERTACQEALRTEKSLEQIRALIPGATEAIKVYQDEFHKKHRIVPGTTSGAPAISDQVSTENHNAVQTQHGPLDPLDPHHGIGSVNDPGIQPAAEALAALGSTMHDVGQNGFPVTGTFGRSHN